MLKKEINLSFNILLAALVLILCFSVSPKKIYAAEKLIIDLNETTIGEINSGSKETKYTGNSVTVDGKVIDNVEIKGRGNSTWTFEKKPYQLKFESKESLFGLEASKTWIILANYLDVASLRNDTALYMANELNIGFDNNGKWVDVYAGDDYLGLYYLCHKNKIEKACMNLKDQNAIVVEMDFESQMASDDIYQISKLYKRAISVKDTNGDENTTLSDFMVSYNALEAAAKQGSFEECKKVADMDSFARYFLINEFTKNPDGYTKSVYMYKDGFNDVIHAGPVWDYDIAFASDEQPWNLDFSDFFTSNTSTENWSTAGIYKDLMKISEFRTLVTSIYNDEFEGIITSAINRMDSQYKSIETQIIADLTKYPRDILSPYDQFEKMKTWMIDRQAYMTLLYSKEVNFVDGIYSIVDSITNIGSEIKIEKSKHFVTEKDGKYIIFENKKFRIITLSDIFKQVISNASIELEFEEAVYTGQPIQNKTLSIEVNGKTLKKDIDFTQKYNKTNINVGTAVKTFTGIGDYSGTKKVYFEIKPRTLSMDNTEIYVDETTCLYTSKEVKPEIVVVCSIPEMDSVILKEHKDYMVSFSDNINLGTAKMTITGIGNFSGSVEKSFEIVSDVDRLKNISNADITLKYYTAEYTGKAIQPSTTKIELFGQVLEKDVDFVHAYNKTNVNVGTAEKTFKGIGDYSGSIIVRFEIVPRTLTEENTIFVFEKEENFYTGDEVIPELSVLCNISSTNTRNLVKDVDYTVSYSDNIRPGFASMTITGIGNYCGSITKTFSITDGLGLLTDISNADIQIEFEEAEYTGKQIQPKTKLISVNGIDLIKDVDFTQKYNKTNINAGTAKKTFTGIGNCTGKKTIEFVIAPRQLTLENTTVTIANDKYAYTGDCVTPDVDVMCTISSSNVRKLVKDVDYTVTYSNNINAGTAQLVIQGIGNYCNEVSKSFTITNDLYNVSLKASDYSSGMSVENAVFGLYDTNTDARYDTNGALLGGYSPVAIAVTDINGEVNISGLQYGKHYWLIALSTPTGYIGESNVLWFYRQGPGTSIFSSDFSGIEKSINATNDQLGFSIKMMKDTIIDGSNTSVSLEKTSFSYTGSSIKPEITVTQKKGSDTIILTKGIDYSVSYQDNVDIGTATVTVTGKGNYTGTISKTFEITSNKYNVVIKMSSYITGVMVPNSVYAVYDNERDMLNARFNCSDALNGAFSPVAIVKTDKSGMATINNLDYDKSYWIVAIDITKGFEKNGAVIWFNAKYDEGTMYSSDFADVETAFDKASNTVKVNVKANYGTVNLDTSKGVKANSDVENEKSEKNMIDSGNDNKFDENNTLPEENMELDTKTDTEKENLDTEAVVNNGERIDESIISDDVIVSENEGTAVDSAALVLF